MSDNLLIIDTDPGVDDALAILIALNRQTRHLANVLAITTVRGNVGVDQASLNVLRILQVADRLDIPVHRGVDHPLVWSNDEEPESSCHGKDGLGDVPDVNSPDSSHLSSEHAVLALIRLANQHPGQITLVCIGPLTNVAVALRLDPQFGIKLRRCVIMGGNTTAQGNVTASAEFNFHCDPEAANVVLTELKCPIVIIPWELCLNLSLPWEVHDKLFEQSSRRSQFVSAIHSTVLKYYYNAGQSTTSGKRVFDMCDEHAVAFALDEKIALELVEAACSVETRGSLTRGQMVVDRRPLKTSFTNVKLVTKIDMERCLQLVASALVD